MATLTELHEKRGELVTQARSALEEIKSDTDAARATELEQRHDTIMAELDKLDATIKREERVAELERQQEERNRHRRPDMSGEHRGDSGEKKDGAAEYRDAFLALCRAGFDPQELSPEQRAVIRRGIVGEVEHRAQTTSNTAGGYTVPTDLARNVDVKMAMWGPMYDEAICTVLTTASGNPIDFPTVDDTTTAMAKHTEGSAMTDDGGVDVTFGKMTLNAFAYDSEWIQVSYELLQDSVIDMEAFLGELIGERVGRRVNTELTTGDNNGDPNGIVTASAAGKTAADVAAFTFDELIDLFHSVDPAYRMSPKCRWMMNDTTLKAVKKLKDGDGQYIWSMGDVRNGEPDRIQGKPYSVNQAMASPATGTKPIVFGDFSKYFVRKVGSPLIGVRREYYWPNIGLVGIVRLDGDLIQSAAVKHLVMA